VKKISCVVINTFFKEKCMPFDKDPFKQAAAEVVNKSMGDQIANSGVFHSMRSAFNSPGSAASKGAGAALAVGKLFLALIPVPIVGAIVGAVADAVNSKVRGAAHNSHTGAGKSNAENAKFLIKELTVENLDRYRWKVAHAYEELNKGIDDYNKGPQFCDDMYKMALLYQQVQRRNERMLSELKKFEDVTNYVKAWMAELEQQQGVKSRDVMIAVTSRVNEGMNGFGSWVETNPADKPKIAAALALHAKCTQWCCIKREAKYNPDARWADVKSYAGQVSSFLKPIAVSAVAVRQSDYTSNDDNSKLRG
jgi:hypothetical protein